MELKKADGRDLRKMKRIYLYSFPKAERKPFGLMKVKARQGVMELLALKSGKKLLGMAVTVLYKDLVLLDYFALAGSCRGCGRGSEGLKLLKERYAEKRMLLEIELPSEAPLQHPERIRRKKFYLRNGMQETGMHVMVFGVPMEVLTAGGALTYEEYHTLYKNVIGTFFAKKVSLLQETVIK